ncbi:MAG: pectinesterase family protein, partial [Candidatus Izemoplasmatales bacterium]
GPTEPLQIRLAPGVYREKLRIYNNNLELIGSGAAETVISYADYNDKLHLDGKQYNTFRTPTVTILADHVKFSHLTIRNEAGYGPGINQAVALSVYGDDFSFKDGVLEGFQDTLFLGPLPRDLCVRYQGFLKDEELHTRSLTHFFERVKITGHVDYIFGSSTALFKDCEIVSVMPGYVAAPSTYRENPVGFVFYNCLFKNISDSDNVYLARPWREHGFTCFWNCRFEGAYHKDRFHDWNKTIYRFFEKPYVETSMSHGLKEERISEIRKLFKAHFDCALPD